MGKEERVERAKARSWLTGKNRQAGCWAKTLIMMPSQLITALAHLLLTAASNTLPYPTWHDYLAYILPVFSMALSCSFFFSFNKDVLQLYSNLFFWLNRQWASLLDNRHIHAFKAILKSCVDVPYFLLSGNPVVSNWVFVLFLLFRATPSSDGSSQARDQSHSHNHVGSKPNLRPIPQLRATQDP